MEARSPVMYQSPRWHFAVASGFFQYSWNMPTGRSGLTRMPRSPSSPRGSSRPSSSTMPMRCPGAETVAQRRVAVLLERLLDHHAVGRRRREEGCDGEALEHGKRLLRVELLAAGVPDEESRAHVPRRKEAR